MYGMHKKNLNFRLKVKSYDSHASKKEAEGRKEGREKICKTILLLLIDDIA